MQSSPTQIVLLGGGYVSVWAYRSLVKRLRTELANGQAVITVVSPHEYHFFHGWTAESLTDVIQNQNRLSPLSEIMPKARLVLATAEALDQTAQVVYVRAKNGEQQAIRYDQLLMGIGSFDSDAIEGIRAYGYQIKSPEAFRTTYQALRKLVKQAAFLPPAKASRLLSITVAGGGFAGVELVTNIAEWLELAMQDYPSLSNVRPQIRLINRGDHVLSALEPSFTRLVRYAEKTMRQYGIKVHNNLQLTRVTPEGAYLSNGAFVESSLVLSTVGQSRFVLAGTEEMPRDPQQRLFTNAYQQVNDIANIWGGGDACHVTHFQTGTGCPSNALWAIKHGKYAGRNIARAIQGKRLKPFTYRGLGQAASLGIGKGIGELYGFQLIGLVAWVMRWFFFLYYMPSRRLMINTIGDWFHLLFSGWRKGALQTHEVHRTNSVRMTPTT